MSSKYILNNVGEVLQPCLISLLVFIADVLSYHKSKMTDVLSYRLFVAIIICLGYPFFSTMSQSMLRFTGGEDKVEKKDRKGEADASSARPDNR
jgi:Na+/phosphate symporter